LIPYKFINSLLKEEVISKKKYKDYQVLYFISKKNFYIPRDLISKYKKIIHNNFLDNFIIKKKLNLYSKKNFFFRISLNGFLIFDINKNKVIKSLSKKYEKNFLQNEKKGSIILKENYPKVFSSRSFNNYWVLEQKLENYDVINNSEYNRILIKVFKRLLSNRNKINKIYYKNVSSFLRKTIFQKKDKKKFFKKEFIAICKLFEEILSKYYYDKFANYNFFCHGDLMKNNILKKNTKFYVIDFANGGIHSFAYDLSIMSLYNHNSPTWVNFDMINFLGNFDRKVFNGMSKFFFNRFSKKFKIRLNEKQAKLSIIISLAEVFIKNYNRHQSRRFFKEGKFFLENIYKILINIKKSCAQY
jgi:hypothetical protein